MTPPAPDTWALDLLFSQMAPPAPRLEDLDRFFELLAQDLATPDFGE